MYKVGNHCWSSQKCGCQLAQYVWGEINTHQDYVFYQGRNPFDRVVSLYAGHFVDINGVMWWNAGCKSTLDMPYEQRGYTIAQRDPKKLFGFSAESVCDYTFEKFIFEVLNKDMTTNGDVHVRCQTIGSPDRKFDDIILLNELPEGYSNPLQKLNMEINLDFEDLKKDTNVIKKIVEKSNVKDPNKIKHITPKSDLNDLDAAKVTPQEWWKYKSFPSNYSCFYKDKNVIERVQDLYEKDFEFFKEYDIYCTP